jgi:glucose-1-phosphate adenylyltransferase
MGNDKYESLEELDNATKQGVPHVGIGERCQLSYTIVDKNCKIGNDVIIQGGMHLEDTETDTYIVRDGVVVIRNGATIPSGTKI